MTFLQFIMYSVQKPGSTNVHLATTDFCETIYIVDESLVSNKIEVIPTLSNMVSKSYGW